MKKSLRKFIGLFPHRLPHGKEQFDQFCKRIFITYEIPDMRSYREAVATMIMHLPPIMSHASLLYFGRSIRKAQSNQVAYQMIQELKAEFKKEEEEKRLAEESIPKPIEILNS